MIRICVILKNNILLLTYISSNFIIDCTKLNVCIRQGPLGRRGIVPDSWTCRTVLKKLEVKGFVLRSRRERDARDLCISLTESGNRLMEDALQMGQNLMREYSTKREKSERIQELLAGLIGLLTEEYEEKVGKDFRVL